MIAELPMYDHPEIRDATDQLWVAIRDGLRAEGVSAPDALSRSDDHTAAWLAPDLLLGQTCSLPYRVMLQDNVALVGAFDYGLPDTPPGHYISRYVVRVDDPRDRVADFAGARLAYNDPMSQSGWGSVWLDGVPLVPSVETGAHRQSAQAVAEGRADIAALDAVTWRLLSAHEPDIVGQLKTIGHTPPVPGLPLITANADLVPVLQRVLAAVVYPAALGIRGFVPLTPQDHRAIPNPPDPQALASKIG